MDCFSSSFKNCSWSWLVCSIRASFETGDDSPTPSETFSFRRTRTSTGLESSRVSFVTSLGVSVVASSGLAVGLAITEADKVFSSFGFSFEGSLVAEEVVCGCLVWSLPSVLACSCEEDSSLTVSVAWAPSEPLSCPTVGLTSWLPSFTTRAGVSACPSCSWAETVTPQKKHPTSTDTKPTAYFRKEKRCCLSLPINRPPLYFVSGFRTYILVLILCKVNAI